MFYSFPYLSIYFLYISYIYIYILYLNEISFFTKRLQNRDWDLVRPSIGSKFRCASFSCWNKNRNLFENFYKTCIRYNTIIRYNTSIRYNTCIRYKTCIRYNACIRFFISFYSFPYIICIKNVQKCIKIYKNV